MSDRARPLLLLFLFVVLLLAALQMPGVRLPFVQPEQTRPLPGMNPSQCAAAGGHFDIILGCAR